MSFEYICSTYSVPAKKGGRVLYMGGESAAQGVITGTRDAYILVKFDGKKQSVSLHPTWMIRYL